MPYSYGQYNPRANVARSPYAGQRGGQVAPRRPTTPYPGPGQVGGGYGQQPYRGGQITNPYGGMGQVPQPFPSAPPPGMGQPNPYGGGIPQPFPSTPLPGYLARWQIHSFLVSLSQILNRCNR